MKAKMKRGRKDSDERLPSHKLSKHQVSFSSLPSDTIGTILSFLDTHTLTNEDFMVSTKPIYQFLKMSSNEFWKQVFINNFSDNKKQDCSSRGEFGNESCWYDLLQEIPDSFITKKISVFNCGSVQTGKDFIHKCDKVEHDWKRIVHEKSIVEKWYQIVKGVELPIAAAAEVVMEPFYLYNNNEDTNILEMFSGALKNSYNNNFSLTKEWIQSLKDDGEEESDRVDRLKQLHEALNEYSGYCPDVGVLCMENSDTMGLMIFYLQNFNGSFLGLYISPYY
jgi:ribose 5-phosphate isomerase RpiB